MIKFALSWVIEIDCFMFREFACLVFIKYCGDDIGGGDRTVYWTNDTDLNGEAGELKKSLNTLGGCV